MIDVHKISTNCTRNEFVGTAVLDTIGLVISADRRNIFCQLVICLVG